VYGVATLELMVCSLLVAKVTECVLTMTQVHYNRSIIQSGENTWGFGQIIAIILTFGIFIDVVVAIRDWHGVKKQRRSKEVYTIIPRYNVIMPSNRDTAPISSGRSP
jgi:hypothetical protein